MPSFSTARFFRPAAVVALFTAFAAPPVLAVEAFVLRDIRVEGLQRTDPGTVFAALPFRVGDNYTDDKAAAALRALFATGLFKDFDSLAKAFKLVSGEIIEVLAKVRIAKEIRNVEAFHAIKEFFFLSDEVSKVSRRLSIDVLL